MNAATSLAAAIRLARIKAGLSQQAVADALGIAEVNTVWRWEAGTRSPSAVDFLKLCKLLHIDPRKLLPPDVGGASLETEQD